jgi:hypothetical protein
MDEKISMASKDQIIQEVNLILSQYSMRLTLRQIYYRLVAKQIVENKTSQYKRLSRILVDARKERLVSPDKFEDKTRSVDVVFERLFGREQIWLSHVKFFKDRLLKYTLDRWLNQSKKIVVVLEKQALENVFQVVCDELDVTLVVGKGYNSYTQLRELSIALKRMVETRELHFLMFGDFDPSGKDILRNFESQLRELGIVGTFSEVALTVDQIQEYNLPPAPVKVGDTRSDDFVQKYGRGVVELDALDPNLLQELVRINIERFFDPEIYEGILVLEAQYQEYFSNQIEEFGI